MMDEYKIRRAINFDFDTKKMKEQGVYPSGYAKVKKFFKKNGFSHRQGSGYLSDKEMYAEDVVKVASDLLAEFSWVAVCARKMDLTNYQPGFDLTQFVVGADVNMLRNHLKGERKKRSPEKDNNTVASNDRAVRLRQFEKDVAIGKKKVSLAPMTGKDTQKGKGK